MLAQKAQHWMSHLPSKGSAFLLKRYIPRAPRWHLCLGWWCISHTLLSDAFQEWLKQGQAAQSPRQGTGKFAVCLSMTMLICNRLTNNALWVSSPSRRQRERIWHCDFKCQHGWSQQDQLNYFLSVLASQQWGRWVNAWFLHQQQWWKKSCSETSWLLLMDSGRRDRVTILMVIT